MPKVKAQGKTFNFPDGTTTEQMSAAIDEYFSSVPDEVAAPKEDLTAEQFNEQFGDVPDIGGRITPQEPEPERTIGEKLEGAGEAALTTLTGATTGAAGAITGTIDQLIEEVSQGKFGTGEAANRIAERAAELQSALTYLPKTETGQEYVGAIGEAGEALAPLAGVGGQLAQAGQLARAGAPQAQAVIAPAARAASKATDLVSDIQRQPGEIAKAVFSYQSPVKQRIAQKLESGISDTDTAKFKIDTPAPKAEPQSRIAKALGAGSARIKTDKLAVDAIDQGFDEGVIATVKGAAPTDRDAMRKMINIYERGTKNATYRAKNRPTDVIGDRIVDTVGVVKRANKKAGLAINKAAENLKGKPVDSQSIGDRFIESLNDAGVSISDDLKLAFGGSDFEDLPAVERTFKTVFRRMAAKKRPDAYELHRMKRFIDEQVSYGKGGEGLTGRAESMLKALRRDIDDTLDNDFPEYNEANTIYSDTIQALDSIQDAAGKKIDLDGENANKALGTLMRRVLSNAQSRVNVMDAVSGIEDMARKYPGQLLLEGPGGVKKKPDVAQLIMFADELDSRFGPSARGSFQGQIEQVAQRGRQIAQGQSATLAATDALVGAAARGLDKVRGVSDEKALKALKELLKDKK